MEEITVIMVQHNRGDYTLRSCKSLIDSNINSRCLILDANSDKAELEKIKHLNPIVLHKNVSIGFHKNLLIATAQTKYILVADNDMEYSIGWLDKALELMDRSGADLLGLWNHPLHTKIRDICDGVKEMNMIPGNCWLCKKELFEKCGWLKEIPAERFESEIGEDTEYINRIRSMGYKAYSVSENLMTHFGVIRSDGGVSSDARFINQ